MDLQQYVQDAIRTESRIEKVTTNATTLHHALEAFIAVGTILDYIKKNVFYKKPIDNKKYSDAFNRAFTSIAELGMMSAERTDGEFDNDIQIDARVFHAIIGAMTESAELGEALQKAITGKEVDLVNVLEEFGDINWYQAIAVDALKGDFEETLKRNIAKLKARFPEKFTNENAINRDLETERKILEGVKTDCSGLVNRELKMTVER
jgi:NTP pyrophosphatase (non-canonical NTP hydrolase)